MDLFIFPPVCRCNVFPWLCHDRVLLSQYRIISPFLGLFLSCVVENAESCIVPLPLYRELLLLFASYGPSCGGHKVHLLVAPLLCHTQVEMVLLPWLHVLLYDTPLMLGLQTHPTWSFLLPFLLIFRRVFD